ncbi:MAG: chromate transporter [Bacteroidales bacterium]|nr:chromate transporter [Bacteroidales bacterium]
MLWQLFITFFKIGAFTFGGGWAMISIIEKEVVDKRHWVTKEDFLDQLIVAQSLPGLLAANIAVGVGDKIRGRIGSIISTIGIVLPSFLMILIIAIFLTPDLINHNPTLAAIFKGIRPAVVALIIAPVITTAKTAKLKWSTAWIPFVVALLIWSKWPIVSNPILWVVLGALGGILIAHRAMRRSQKTKVKSQE